MIDKKIEKAVFAWDFYEDVLDEWFPNHNIYYLEDAQEMKYEA